MPTAEIVNTLHPIHLEAMESVYGDVSDELLGEEAFISHVCSDGMVLPEYKAGSSWHMPCCWLGDPGESIHHVNSPEGRKAANRRLGWKRLKYLIILPALSSADRDNRIALCPKTQGGVFLRKELARAGIDLKDVMVTHVCRFALPDTLKTYSQKHHKANLPYLFEDIRRINPDVIITCGAPSLKALFGRRAKLDTYQGNIIRYEDEAAGIDVPVVPTVSHLAFLGGHANLSVFRSELRRAREIVEGVYSQRRIKPDYRTIDTVEGVRALCDEIRAARPAFLSFDTEFGNDVAREEFTYTLSVQLSWAPGKAAFIKLRDQKMQDPYWIVKYKGKPRKDGTCKAYNKLIEPGLKCGIPIHTEEEEHEIWRLLQELMLDKTWRLVAHHLRTDVDQFARNGFPIDDRIRDGIDTMLIHHLLYGDENQGLDHLVRKYAPEFGAFWMELEEWFDANGRGHLDYGYRDVPLDILIPYACQDADATIRIAYKLLGELAKQPDIRRLYVRHVAPTSLHLLDVERQGILIDEERRMELYNTYKPVYDELLERLREKINWPSFNPGSNDQVPYLLFSKTPYRDKKKCAPDDAKLFDLQPVFNTDKYPKDWGEIRERGEEEYNKPSTKAAALELLLQENPDIVELRWLRHLSVIGKFLSNYLHPSEYNGHGVFKDGRGLHCNIHQDGRVRTHISQLTQTGRYTSFKANLQTKPKRQEAAAFAALVDYHFGVTVDEYKKRTYDGETKDDGTVVPSYDGPDAIPPEKRIKVPKFASCFVAPEGYALIEADFKTAELFIWAYCSSDPALIEIVSNDRNLHAEVAVRSFQLPEAKELPDILATGDKKLYKGWVEKIKDKYPDLYVGAKTVNFGIMYGRGASALAREINKVVDSPVTPEETQAIIDGVAKAFPIAWQWICDNAERAVEQEFIANAFGRKRYFQGAGELSERDQASVRREAKNSPIQGAVADLLAQAGIQLYRFLHSPVGSEIDMKVLLPVHDAFLFEVKYEDVPKAIKAIELCMSRENKLPGTPHFLKLDIEIYPHRWSDKPVKPQDLVPAA